MYIRRDRHCLSVLDLFLFESCCFISFVSNFGAFSAEADFRASNLYLKGDFMGKKALITGVTGQDGSYLTELLLSKGYEVHGIVRRASTMNRERIDHIHRDDHAKGNKLFIHYGDLADGEQISDIVYNVKPDEIYHLGAQSHVRVSFDIAEYTGNVTGLGTTRILEAIRRSKKKIKFYQASSSEMFGSTKPPQSENTPFAPRSPYACAKLQSFYMQRYSF